MVLIVDDILKIPFTIGMKVLEEISKQVDGELLLSEDSIRKKIIEMRLEYENGNINGEEYSRINKNLRKRLAAATQD